LAFWTVIYNPVSGGCKHGAERRQHLEQALRLAGIKYELVETTAHGDAESRAVTAWVRGSRHIACAGGDGTAHQIVNGFVDAAGGPERTGVSFGLIPLGTGNDLARMLGLPHDMVNACALLRTGRCRQIDIGLITGSDDAGAALQRYFINVAGAGFDARVAAIMAGRPKNALYYLQGLLRVLPRFRCPVFRVESDGPQFRGPAMTVATAIGRYFGSGLSIAPHAVLDDGEFAVTIVLPMSSLQVLARVPALLFGDISRSRHVETFRCRTLSISGDAALEAEGEVVCPLPVTLRLIPRALTVIVPDSHAGSSDG